MIGVNFELKMDVTENSKLKRRIRALERENKRLKQDNEIDKIIQTVNKIHKALKPRYVRLDELVRNSGLQHIAQNIFQHLDLPTLSRCRQVSSSWKICIDNDKYWWKKLLKHKSFIWTGNGMDLPDLVETLNYICAKETLANMKLFGQLVLDYFLCLKKPQLWKGFRESASFDTPIHYAAHKNRLDIFDFLANIPVLPNLNIQNRYEYSDQLQGTLLGNACAENQTLVLEYFMNLKGAKKIDFNCKIEGYEEGDRGFSLFHEACKFGNIEVVKLFLKYADELNIDLNLRESTCVERWTPFMLTSSTEVLELLLNDKRIDVNATNDDGDTLLSYAFDYNNNDEEENVELIDCLLRSPRIDLNSGPLAHLQRTLLHRACQNKFHQRAEALLKAAIKRGFDVNQKDLRGLTAAHFAFGYNMMGFTGNLLEVTLPFTLTKFSPTIEVILKFTKELDIDLEATDDKGRTPLHYLARARSESLVKQFLEAARNEYGIELNVNAMDHDGKTPFSFDDDE